MLEPFVEDLEATEHAVGVEAPAGNQVFIVHGRDPGSLVEIEGFVERMGFEPMSLDERTDRGRAIIEIPRNESWQI